MNDVATARVAVLGAGAVGCYFGGLLARAGLTVTLVGRAAHVDAIRRDGLTIAWADRRETVRIGASTDVAAVRDADVVLVATPVGEFPALFQAMAGTLAEHAVLTDGGSTKHDVVAAARAHLGAILPRFVPAHPIAGTEQSGAGAAFPTLFEGRRVVLTPLPETDPHALARIRALWEACGAEVVTLDAPRHDRIFAAVSHLPHYLAAAYVADLAVRPDASELFGLAGTGFRDFTRIAAASPEMWRDIGIANRDALRRELAAFRGALDVLDAALRDGNAHALAALLESAAQARRAWSARATGD